MITDTLKSVQRQTYRHWRCIVVDNGSINDTARRVQAFVHKDRRLAYIRKHNGGEASARDLGVRLAVGEYIAPLDGDDNLHPDCLRHRAFPEATGYRGLLPDQAISREEGKWRCGNTFIRGCGSRKWSTTDVVDDPVTSCKLARQLFTADVVRHEEAQPTRIPMPFNGHQG